MNVGLNRRKKLNKTEKSRYVTERNGFGKLACFGLFETFIVEIVKDNLQSTLVVNTFEDESFTYTAEISHETKPTTENNGTTVSLINNLEKITDNTSLAESITKRINLIYDGNADDSSGYTIELEDIAISKTFRNEIVLNFHTRFLKI